LTQVLRYENEKEGHPGFGPVGLFSFPVKVQCPTDCQLISIELRNLQIPKAALAKMIGFKKAQIENAGGESSSMKK
jgi:hypothetical protein